MTPHPLTLPDPVDPQRAFDELDAGRRKLAPVVDADGGWSAILTRTAALRATMYRPATDA